MKLNNEALEPPKKASEGHLVALDPFWVQIGHFQKENPYSFFRRSFSRFWGEAGWTRFGWEGLASFTTTTKGGNNNKAFGLNKKLVKNAEAFLIAFPISQKKGEP